MTNVNNKNFYPTPKHLVKKMFNKINHKGSKLKYILEPSAGKGDLIEEYCELFKMKTNTNSSELHYYITFDAIEKDPNLCHILKGKNINLIDRDFLKFEAEKYYDIIIGNPPFDEGSKHLLHAIKIQERVGGQIVFLLNAETLKNPFSNERKELVRILNNYNADIEYLEKEFIGAERRTNVETALIYINISMKDSKTLFEKELEKELRKEEGINIEEESMKQIVPNMSKFDQLVLECETIKKSGVKLFEEKQKIDMLLESMNLKKRLTIATSSNAFDISVNQFIQDVNHDYWTKLISETNLYEKVPTKLRTKFANEVLRKQENITFNKDNVKYFIQELVKNIPLAYEETVADIFDRLTMKYAYSDSMWNKTIHYYNGWKTNDSFKINKKVIIPISHNYFFRIPDVLEDLNIIFQNISGENYSLKDDLRIEKAMSNCEKKIDTKFFILDSYKKGTLHITFKNQKHLDQFNYLAAKGKKWLPPHFGEKLYIDMTKEEKGLLKEFNLDENSYKSFGQDYLRLSM